MNQFGYDGFLPGSIIIDLLIIASTFITIHLSILRLQRVNATAELDDQRRAAEEQAALLGTVYESMNAGLVIVDRPGVVRRGGCTSPRCRSGWPAAA